MVNPPPTDVPIHPVQVSDQNIHYSNDFLFKVLEKKSNELKNTIDS